MVIPIDQAVTSYEALMSTVAKDHQVYCWFTHLVGQAALKGRFSGEDDAKRAYGDLDRIAFAQKILCGVLLLVLGAVFFWGPQALIGAGLAALASVVLQRKKKNVVTGICSRLFLEDFEKFLFAKKTLYQIGEYYSQEYKIVSLVDVIAASDRTLWSAFIVTLFVTCFIYPSNPAYILLWLAASFHVVRAAVNTSLAYKYIQ